MDRAPGTGLDLWLLPLAGPREPRAWLRTPSSETHPELSPDGRWMAYASDVSGRYEVYVQPFPGPGGTRYQVSLAGGQAPLWSRDGRELFYVTDGRPRRLMGVAVQASSEFAASRPREVIARDLAMTGGASAYDVAPDGRRFVVLEEVETPDRAVTELQLVLNGFALLAPGHARD